MTTVKLKLDSIETIKKFNNTVAKYSCDFDLEQGRYYIDGKSMMGLLSLDLNSPIDMHFQSDEEVEAQILSDISEFLVEA